MATGVPANDARRRDVLNAGQLRAKNYPKSSSVCVVDAEGRIVREAKVLSKPDALIAWFAEHGAPMERIGLEAGPLSQWLYAAMARAGLAVESLETRQVRAAFKTMYG